MVIWWLFDGHENHHGQTDGLKLQNQVRPNQPMTEVWEVGEAKADVAAVFI